MPGERAASVLRGRSEECRALDRLLDGARAGQSSALVIRGEAGVGKTALLDYIAERASGCMLARIDGASIRRWASRSPVCSSCSGARCSNG